MIKGEGIDLPLLFLTLSMKPETSLSPFRMRKNATLEITLDHGEVEGLTF